MTPWNSRSPEEQGLLNPSFCAVLLWHAASGHTEEVNRPIAFELLFIVLPFVLHRETREALPRTSTTSLPAWLDRDPLLRSKIADRASLLVEHTKEALTFSGLYDLLRVAAGGVEANTKWKKKISRILVNSSEEVRQCAKRAEFVGKWFGKSGDASTVMAFMGVKP